MAQKENLDLSMLYNQLSKPPWYIKTEVLKILELRKTPSSAKHIEVVLNESNDEVRRTAAVALGQIGGEVARTLLVKLTQDQNPFVRKTAEKSLTETSDLKFL
jgi:HEAT repeat protein